MLTMGEQAGLLQQMPGSQSQSNLLAEGSPFAWLALFVLLAVLWESKAPWVGFAHLRHVVRLVTTDGCVFGDKKSEDKAAVSA